MILLEIFWEFFKAGLFSIGGGLATIPFLYDIASRYDWLDAEIIPDMIAISESTPGPIGTNMATYTGFMAAGVIGGIIATIGEVLPSVLIILLISKFLTAFHEDSRVLCTLYGLRPASLALISAAAYAVLKASVLTLETYYLTGKFIDIIDLKALILFVCLFVLRLFLKKIHPIVFIIFAGIVGVVFQF
ncbi:MAG: chromate transporter [Clostridia bacterium]|jgi:chromate transporter